MTAISKQKQPAHNAAPPDIVEGGVDKLVTPDEHYDAPKDVAKDKSLTRAEKVKALDNWELNERQLQVATEEGMGGGKPNRLADVAKAKSEIGEGSIEKITK